MPEHILDTGHSLRGLTGETNGTSAADMRVLVLGSGGREHALAWKISQSPRVSEVFVAPGNAGTGRTAHNVPIDLRNLDGLVQFAQDQRIDLTVVGPDDALAAGVVDLFQQRGARIFGPNRRAAQLESSKSFAKAFMVRHGIPTARYESFDSSEAAVGALERFGFPLAIKADGLSLGKGVIIAEDRPNAETAIRDMMESGRFGPAGKRIVLEQFLTGTECSVHALVDGQNYLLFPTAQDHKQLYEGNRGPNTGGMGAFSPSRSINKNLIDEIERSVLKPFLRGIQEEQIDYRGLLFPGLMLTSEGIKVLEFNARFGDPETQAILPRLESDLVDLLESTIDRRLGKMNAKWSERASVCVVMASGGYPFRYETGKLLTGLEDAAGSPDLILFHAGTRQEGERTVTCGGRVIGVTAIKPSLSQAAKLAYDTVAKIHFDCCYFRRDIGTE